MQPLSGSGVHRRDEEVIGEKEVGHLRCAKLGKRSRKRFEKKRKKFWQKEKSYYLCRPEREKRSGIGDRKEGEGKIPGKILKHGMSAFG